MINFVFWGVIFIALVLIFNDYDYSIDPTHPSYPQDTFNAGKGKVEDAKPYNSVHYGS